MQPPSGPGISDDWRFRLESGYAGFLKGLVEGMVYLGDPIPVICQTARAFCANMGLPAEVAEIILARNCLLLDESPDPAGELRCLEIGRQLVQEAREGREDG